MISDLFATMAVGVGHDDDEPSSKCPCVPRCPHGFDCRRRRMPGDGPSKDCLCGQGRCSVQKDAVFRGRKIFVCYIDNRYGQLAPDSTDSNGFSPSPCHFRQFVDASPEEVQTSVRDWAARSRWCERRGHFIDGAFDRVRRPEYYHPRPCAPELQTGDRRCTYLDDAYVPWVYRPTVDYLVECPCRRPRCTGLTRPHGDPDYDAYFNAKKDIHGWVCDHGDVCPVQVKVPRCTSLVCPVGPIDYDVYRARNRPWNLYIPRRQCHNSSHHPDVLVHAVQPCTAPDTEHLERHWRSMREAEAEAAKAATVQTATPCDVGMAEGNKRQSRGKRKPKAQRLAARATRQAATEATSGGDDDDGSECMGA